MHPLTRKKKKIHKKTFYFSPIADLFLLLVPKKGGATTAAKFIKIRRKYSRKKCRIFHNPCRDQ